MGVKTTTSYKIKGNSIAMVYQGAEVELDYEIDGDTLILSMGSIMEFNLKRAKK
jgi:hypothetical protein